MADRAPTQTQQRKKKHLKIGGWSALSQNGVTSHLLFVTQKNWCFSFTTI